MEFQESNNVTPPPFTNKEKSRINLSSYDKYYQEEFQKIIDSGETYKGKWNWFAFLFGAIWLLVKGAWVYALILFAICIIISNFSHSPYLGFSVAFASGRYGTWIYYNVKIKNIQLPKSF